MSGALNITARLWQACLALGGQLAEKRCRVCLVPLPHFPAIHPSRICGICPDCLAGLGCRPEPSCLVCGEDLVAGFCPDCLEHPKTWGRVYFLAAYAGTLRMIIRRIKFGGDLSLAEGLGRLLALLPDLKQSQGAYDCIVPIPLHPRRLASRGFNQALEIARPISSLLRIPICNSGIARKGDTHPQSRLSRRERMENMRLAFVSTQSWRERRVLLLDDVLTTGATLEAASLCLREAGALAVDVAVSARTPVRR